MHRCVGKCDAKKKKKSRQPGILNGGAVIERLMAKKSGGLILERTCGRFKRHKLCVAI